MFSLSAEIPKFVSDLNSELVNAFEVVRDQPEALLSEVLSIGVLEEDFYKVRASYNDLKSAEGSPPLQRATQFIYLNRTSFNGLYRENKSGLFNVPWGKKTDPLSNLESIIIPASVYLRAKQANGHPAVSISATDYSVTLEQVTKGDWVYLDPPYDSLNGSASFSDYTSSGFDREDQVLLRDRVRVARDKGAGVMLSNSDTPFVRSLYPSDEFRLMSLDVRRSIGAAAATRKNVGELLVLAYG